MDATLSALLNFYIFTTGRRLFAMKQVRQAADSAGLADLVAHCDAAIDHDGGARDLDARWLGQNVDAQFSPEARQIDILVDTTLGALRDGVDAAARTSAPGDALGTAAVKLNDLLFPKGSVASITTLPMVEELAQVQRILKAVTSPEWSATVQDLGLSRHVARLAALEPQYRAALEAAPGKVAFAAVKDARARGQVLMLQAVAMILGRYPSDAPADLAGRTALLGPILKQNDAIRMYLRSRRAVEDVNPDTGEVEPGSGDTAPPPAIPADQA